MTQQTDSILQQGHAAVARHAWREAYEFLTAADTMTPLQPEDLEKLAEAAWWIGRLPACIAARERAYTAYLEQSNRRRCALIASELARNHFAKGDPAVGSAWLARAERLLQDEPESVEHGYVARIRAVVAFEGQHDPDTALAHAQRVLDIATRFGDRDLMAMALHDRGRILMARGDVSQGVALMDEANLAAVAGELGPMATAIVYCNTITSCMSMSDYPRAREWTEAAKRWCERQAISGFPGMCRVYRAEIMRLRGAWGEAEDEARQACEELRGFNQSYCAGALYELGAIRLRVGDLAGAEDAFRQANELGRSPEPGLSLLRLTEGKVKTAASSIRRALADEALDRLQRAQLLPARVSTSIAAGDIDDAAAAAAELEEIAQAYNTAALDASAASARGAVLLAQGDAVGAERTLRRARHLWQELDCPYEAAQARMLLASAYRAQGDEEAAALELQAARATFERLGATLDARRAAELLGHEEALPRQTGASGRRITRTLMFTDIVRSTNLVEAIGDAAWSDLLRWHHETLRSLFARHGGEEIDHLGDGFFVGFPDAASAFECAVAIQRRLADHRRGHGFAPQVRIGLHTAEVTHRGTGYEGRGVHVAARIGALASGEEILASRETVADASLKFATSTPRSLQLKGIADPVEVVAIAWR